MLRLETSYVFTILLSAALVHCGQQSTSAPPASSPGPDPATAATTPPEQQQQQMTPASGTGEMGAQQTSPATSQPASTPTPGAESMGDEQIFRVMDLANSSEIDQAKIAQTKAKSAQVKNFAAMMISHHSKARDKGMKLSTKLGATPVESPVSTQLKADSEAMTASLKNQPATDFDRMYMDGQVQAHQKVLSTIDDKLMPNARDSELKALLQEMRATVESHLKEAQQIQSSLATAAEKR